MIAGAVDAQIARTPDRVAVVASDATLTYAQLDARVGRLARALAARGAAPGTRVAIALPRTSAAVIGVLAILRSGAAYVPLDLSSPRPRLEGMLADAAPSLLLTDHEVVDRLPGDLPPMVFADAPDVDPAPVLPSSTGPEALGYLMFTSGSTGRPKAVAVNEDVLSNLVRWYSRDIANGLRTLHFAPLSFDVSFTEIFTTLSSGGTLVVAGEDERMDVDALVDLLARERVQHTILPLVMLHQIADAVTSAGLALPDLRVVVSGGEQLVVTDAVRAFFAAHPNARLQNHYGPTEVQIVTVLELAEDPSGWPTLPSIGRPMPGAQVYVLDDHLEPTPLGVPGEIFIGGRVSDGYRNRPGLTAERFVPDGLSGRSGARLYRTGDRGRFLPNGELEFRGRGDGQVKIRGHRVELGEIEATLAALPAVRGAAADVRGGELTAWVVLEPDAAAEIDDLRGALTSRLPSHMIPLRWAVTAELPLSPNGKVDRRRLADVVVESRAPTPPRTERERALAAVFAEALDVDAVGVDESFFELGGDSLRAMRLIHLARRAGFDVGPRTLYRHPTVAGLAGAGDRDDAASQDGLVCIAGDGTGATTVLLAPAAGGSAHPYGRLAARLADRCDVYALEDDRTLGRSVQQLAEAHVAAAAELSASRSLVVAGWSAGGLLAWELACRLEARDAPPSMVVLIDAEPLRTSPVPADDADLLLGIASSFAELSPTRLRELSDLRRLEYVLERARAAGSPLGDLSAHDLALRLPALRDRVRAFADYRPGALDAPVLVLQAEGGLAGERDLAGEWAPYTRRLPVGATVPGDHFAMLDAPHVDELARTLLEHLDAAMPVGVAVAGDAQA